MSTEKQHFEPFIIIDWFDCWWSHCGLVLCIIVSFSAPAANGYVCCN